MAERFFTTYQVAKLVGQTPGTIAEWIQDGTLPAREFPDGPTRVPESGLVEFLKQRGANPREILAGAKDFQNVVESASQEAAPVTAPVEPVLEEDIVPEETKAVDQDLSAESQVADAMLADAVASGADQLHLEPRRHGLTLRLRIGGALREKNNFTARLPARLAQKLIDHFKSLARMEVHERRRPQSGTAAQPIDGREMELHVSTCPTSHGEKACIRLVDPLQQACTLSELALSSEDQSRLRKILSVPGTMVIVAGPPRRGRSAALLAMLNETVRPDRNVVTIGWRMEGEIPGVNQSRIDPAAGFTYAEAMGTFEMQDADVILIQDLRDPVTAAAAVEAARDGRTIVAGMIATDAAAAAASLLEMGVEPWVLAGALSAIVEERPAGQGADAAGQAVHLTVTYVEGKIAAAIRVGKPS
jgi:type II secretory ATPase GspE/PulE/Tfp pilus assembly ATPase PilB-like protein